MEFPAPLLPTVAATEPAFSIPATLLACIPPPNPADRG